MNILRPILILILSVASFSLAEAHAFLDHADPKVGSTVSAPRQVKVFMTEDLERAFSRLQVFDAKGTEVDKKDIEVSGATMTVSLPTLGAGTYKVIWKAVAVDTHRTTGSFTFTIQ
jgi:hypothetical protein